MRRVEATRDLMLPSTKEEEKMMSGNESPIAQTPTESMASGTGGLIGSLHGRPRKMSSAAQRPVFTHAPSTFTIPQPHPHPHAHPNLQIKVTPPSAPTSISIPKRNPVSPLDSYPSPPPSLDDSPPSHSAELPLRHSIPSN